MKNRGRAVFTFRCNLFAAMLMMRGRGHFTNADVADVTEPALRGLVHTDAG